MEKNLSQGGDAIANPTNFDTVEEAERHAELVAKRDEMLSNMPLKERIEWLALNGNDVNDLEFDT